MRVKNSIDYQTQNAISMRQYQYTQSQHYQNWINYYSNIPQFFPGYARTYRSNANPATGFGF